MRRINILTIIFTFFLYTTAAFAQLPGADGVSIGSPINLNGQSCPTGQNIYNNNGVVGCQGGSSGSGTVTSVGVTAGAGGILSVGTPTTTPMIAVAGTSGGVPCFPSATSIASSGSLAAGGLVIGGGAGACPSTDAGISYTSPGQLALIGPSAAIIAPNVGIDSISQYNAAGVITTTTGTISSGHNSLVVASAAGWTVGMGIAVHNAGAGGNTELVTTVSAIVGNTFTLGANASATATGQIVNHDDTAAISAAITAGASSGQPVHLRYGNYNITSGFTIGTPNDFFGDGPYATVIWNRSTTANIFTINYEIPGGGMWIRDFAVSQAATITPSAGYAFNIASASGAGQYVQSLRMSHININNTWGGIFTGTGVISNWFTDIFINNLVGTNNGILVNSPSPSGDSHFDNIEVNSQGSNTGVELVSSDTTEFTNLKINGGAGLLFAGSAQTSVTRVRFVNPSIEGITSSPACLVDFGTNGATQIQFIGGGIGLGVATLCNQANVNQLELVGTDEYSPGSGLTYSFPNPFQLVLGGTSRLDFNSTYANNWFTPYSVAIGATNPVGLALFSTAGNIFMSSYSGSPNQLSFGTTAVIGFNPNASVSGANTSGFSYVGAGIIGVGTGAAGSVAGTIEADVHALGVPHTVAGLPTPAVPGFSFVTDQLTACVGAGLALTGGGAVKCPVFYNGSTWVGM